MVLSSQWYSLAAVSAMRHGIGSRFAAKLARGFRRAAERTLRSTRAAAGFTASIPRERSLAIDDAAGCTLRVVRGQVWITVEGDMRDVIANAGETIAVAQGARTYVSAFCDATILVAPRAANASVTFALSDDMGMRVLTAGVPLGATVRAALRRWGTAIVDAYAAFAQRRAAMLRNAV